jgi:hypothetical protein
VLSDESIGARHQDARCAHIATFPPAHALDAGSYGGRRGTLSAGKLRSRCARDMARRAKTLSLVPQVRGGLAAARSAMRGASKRARWGTLHLVLPLHREKRGVDVGFLLLGKDRESSTVVTCTKSDRVVMSVPSRGSGTVTRCHCIGENDVPSLEQRRQYELPHWASAAATGCAPRCADRADGGQGATNLSTRRSARQLD